MEQRLLFLIRVSNLAYAALAGSPIKNARSGYKTGTFGGKDHAGKIFAVLVIMKIHTPWTCGLSQLPAHQPRGVLHVQVFTHLPQNPLDGRKILAKRTAHELSMAGPIVKRRPR